MPQAGDSYSVRLTESNLGWGIHRYTHSRERIPRETYINIPSFYAKVFHIYNSNHTNGYDILGQNVFNCVSDDGTFSCTLKAGGCSNKGSHYAKNFHGCGNLKALTPWFDSWNAEPRDEVTLTWTSQTDIVLSHS